MVYRGSIPLPPLNLYTMATLKQISDNANKCIEYMERGLLDLDQAKAWLKHIQNTIEESFDMDDEGFFLSLDYYNDVYATIQEVFDIKTI